MLEIQNHVYIFDWKIVPVFAICMLSKYLVANEGIPIRKADRTEIGKMWGEYVESQIWPSIRHQQSADLKWFHGVFVKVIMLEIRPIAEFWQSGLRGIYLPN